MITEKIEAKIKINQKFYMIHLSYIYLSSFNMLRLFLQHQKVNSRKLQLEVQPGLNTSNLKQTCPKTFLRLTRGQRGKALAKLNLS